MILDLVLNNKNEIFYYSESIKSYVNVKTNKSFPRPTNFKGPFYSKIPIGSIVRCNATFNPLAGNSGFKYVKQKGCYFPYDFISNHSLPIEFVEENLGTRSNKFSLISVNNSLLKTIYNDQCLRNIKAVKYNDELFCTNDHVKVIKQVKGCPISFHWMHKPMKILYIRYNDVKNGKVESINGHYCSNLPKGFYAVCGTLVFPIESLGHIQNSNSIGGLDSKDQRHKNPINKNSIKKISIICNVTFEK